MLEWLKDPHYYFQQMEGMINQVFVWVGLGFLLLVLAGVITCLIIAIRKSDWDNLSHDIGVSVWINVVVLMGAFAVVCAVFGSGVFFAEQNYDVGGFYYGFLTQQVWMTVVCIVLAIGAGILVGVACFDSTGWWAVAIGAGVAGASYYAFLWGLLFPVYLIVFFVWLIIRFILLLFAMLGVAFWNFLMAHGLLTALVFATPAVLFAAVEAIILYAKSLGQNVKPIRQGNPRFDRRSRQKKNENER